VIPIEAGRRVRVRDVAALVMGDPAPAGRLPAGRAGATARPPD
jgi:hypothetical protein